MVCWLCSSDVPCLPNKNLHYHIKGKHLCHYILDYPIVLHTIFTEIEIIMFRFCQYSVRTTILSLILYQSMYLFLL